MKYLDWNILHVESEWAWAVIIKLSFTAEETDSFSYKETLHFCLFVDIIDDAAVLLE